MLRLVLRLGVSSSPMQSGIVQTQVRWGRCLWVLFVVALMATLLSPWERSCPLVCEAIHLGASPAALNGALAVVPGRSDQFFFA